MDDTEHMNNVRG